MALPFFLAAVPKHDVNTGRLPFSYNFVVLHISPAQASSFSWKQTVASGIKEMVLFLA
jgi:hypothetical protein